MTNNSDIQTPIRRRPKVYLKDLLKLYEMNYLKIKKLFPKLEDIKEFTFFLPEGKKNAQVNIKVINESKYTSILKINQSSFLHPKLETTSIEVVVYFDFKMAEVKYFNGKMQFWIRNKYPNKSMFQKDEKFQWNKFLSEWLEFSKKEGLASLEL